jgi:hypothetical protein
MEVNERKLKLFGTANLPQSLELGKVYDLEITNAEVRSAGELISNDDGTANEIFRVKISELSEITLKDEKQFIKARKSKGSMAQKLRMEIMNGWSGEGEFEDYYTKQMAEIIELYNS